MLENSLYCELRGRQILTFQELTLFSANFLRKTLTSILSMISFAGRLGALGAILKKASQRDLGRWIFLKKVV